MKRVIWASVAALALANLVAAPISEQDALAAVRGFVGGDAIGAAILGDREVESVTERGFLWVARLSPSGHVILSGSDRAKPIVGFSTDDFVEPDHDSPAYLVLENANAAVVALEGDATASRNAKWDSLLSTSSSKSLLGAKALERDPERIIIPPLLSTHFNQTQPYNDFAPVYNPTYNSKTNENLSAYHGRCPCGCVATAGATLAHYFRWPARIDRTTSFDHVFKYYTYTTNSDLTVTTNTATKTFPIRFDGHVPIDWAEIDAAFDNPTQITNITARFAEGSYYYQEWTEYLVESNRFPIARAILWMDSLAGMQFGTGGSVVANNAVIDATADSGWYTSASSGDLEDFSAAVIENLTNGIPCTLSINTDSTGNGIGHQITIHGWAQDSSTQYAYIDFGWGGTCDGYYDISQSITDNSNYDYTEKSVFYNYYPRAKPQLDPLPKVCDPDNLALSWHFPDFHTNNLEGFTVTATAQSSTITDNVYDFADSPGVITGDEDICGVESDGTLYFISAFKDSDGYVIVNSVCYTFPEVFTLTSASVLTFQLRSYYALNNQFEIQARFNGEDWTTIMTPPLVDAGDSGWGAMRLYLGDHGGETVQLRLVKSLSARCYTNQKSIRIKNFGISSVFLPTEIVGETTFDGSVRSATFGNLESGKDYTFSVTPIFSHTRTICSNAIEGEASELTTITTAGTATTLIPGEETYTTENLEFSTTDTSGVWSYFGSADSDSQILGGYACSILAQIQGKLTENSILTFGWQCNNYYVEGDVDILTISFIDNAGVCTELEKYTNSASMDEMRWCNVPLNGFQGNGGWVRIALNHSNKYNTDSMVIRKPEILNVLVPHAPEVLWETKELTALGMPEILSVTTNGVALHDGFYADCGAGSATTDATPTTTTATTTTTTTTTTTATTTSAIATVFEVECSSSVTNLVAKPSHLSLVSDEDVTVVDNGDGRFTVSITPSGVDETNYRSRMILTLEATDSNGTTVYKDLSLRFDKIVTKGVFRGFAIIIS